MRLSFGNSHNPLRDKQQDEAICYCKKCGGEIYSEEQAETGLCYFCEKEIELEEE